MILPIILKSLSIFRSRPGIFDSQVIWPSKNVSLGLPYRDNVGFNPGSPFIQSCDQAQVGNVPERLYLGCGAGENWSCVEAFPYNREGASLSSWPHTIHVPLLHRSSSPPSTWNHLPAIFIRKLEEKKVTFFTWPSELSTRFTFALMRWTDTTPPPFLSSISPY